MRTSSIPIEHQIQPDLLEINIGKNLLPLLNEENSMWEEFKLRLNNIRKQFAISMGVLLQPIRIRDQSDLGPNEYAISISGVRIAGGQLQIGKIMALDGGETSGTIEGDEFIEPAFGLKAKWIDETEKDVAKSKGYTVATNHAIIMTHLMKIIEQNAADLLSLQEVEIAINSIKNDFPSIVKAVEKSNDLNIGMIHTVAQNLLREGVSFANMVTILQILLQRSEQCKDIALLTEYVRIALSRQICRSIIPTENILPVIAVDTETAKTIEDSIIDDPVFGKVARLTQEQNTKLIHAVSAARKFVRDQGKGAVVLVPFPIRRYFSSLVTGKFPDIRVLSHEEIIPQLEIQIMATVRMND